jgi:hypothetical protein
MESICHYNREAPKGQNECANFDSGTFDLTEQAIALYDFTGDGVICKKQNTLGVLSCLSLYDLLISTKPPHFSGTQNCTITLRANKPTGAK